MKKLLLASVAVGGLAFAAPAHADVELEVGGYFKGYGVFIDQDEIPGSQTNDFDFIRDTEIHIGGETTLDNGLTIGTHFEIEADGADGSADIDESYVYFSGNWGRVNFGNEDGVGYLLQVAAPSADSNIDGIRQYVQPVNYSVLLDGAYLAGLGATASDLDGQLDYDMDPAGKSDKLTYLSPIMNGFQGGVSFSPDTDTSDDFEGVGTDDVAGDIGVTYEIALRYEGQFQNVGVIAGAGYSHGDLEADSGGDDDREVFNVGLDLDISAFGLGVVYMEDNVAEDSSASVDDQETIVVGADYTTGPFKLGLSWMSVDNTLGVKDLDTERYTGGVVYNYGPGMSFRGSVSYIEHEDTDIGGTGINEVEATSFVLGTQINF